MKIELGDKYLLETDSMNVMIKEKYTAEIKNGEGKVIGTEPRIKVVGYYSTPKQALKKLLDYDIMTSDLDGISSILDRIDQYQNLVENLPL